MCGACEPIRSLASHPQLSHRPRAGRRDAAVRQSRAAVRRARGRVRCPLCPLGRVSLGSEELRGERCSFPGVRHGHGGRAGAEGGGLCPEQGFSGLPHEVTIPRGRNRRGHLESGSDAVGEEGQGAPDSGAERAPGQRACGPGQRGQGSRVAARAGAREAGRPPRRGRGPRARRGCAGCGGRRAGGAASAGVPGACTPRALDGERRPGSPSPLR